ncbi:MAG TPA: N,N-dimethylformamidase beta subunit family domain-containing protein, partial [Acidimicrobiales bacterium]|nr:N,N-dimethylformamidase beta subunit family domain-containing protein [Acidimicrobiales bacterium]
TNWIFAGTGASSGQRLAKVVGSEYDRYDPSVPGPRNVEILSHSPLYCRGQFDYSDATYYSAPSGAGVFASGTIDWVGNIDPACPTPDCPGRVLGRVTENLLAAFGAGPAGLAHPSVPDTGNLKGGAGTTAPSVAGGSGGLVPPSNRGTVPRVYRPPVTTRRTFPVTRPPVTTGLTSPPSTAPASTRATTPHS